MKKDPFEEAVGSTLRNAATEEPEVADSSKNLPSTLPSTSDASPSNGKGNVSPVRQAQDGTRELPSRGRTVPAPPPAVAAPQQAPAKPKLKITFNEEDNVLKVEEIFEGGSSSSSTLKSGPNHRSSTFTFGDRIRNIVDHYSSRFELFRAELAFFGPVHCLQTCCCLEPERRLNQDGYPETYREFMQRGATPCNWNDATVAPLKYERRKVPKEMLTLGKDEYYRHLKASEWKGDAQTMLIDAGVKVDSKKTEVETHVDVDEKTGDLHMDVEKIADHNPTLHSEEMTYEEFWAIYKTASPLKWIVLDKVNEKTACQKCLLPPIDRIESQWLLGLLLSVFYISGIILFTAVAKKTASVTRKTVNVVKGGIENVRDRFGRSKDTARKEHIM